MQAWQPRVVIQKQRGEQLNHRGMAGERVRARVEGLRVPSEGDWILFGKLTRVLRS